jgi:hypothetical protein
MRVTMPAMMMPTVIVVVTAMVMSIRSVVISMCFWAAYHGLIMAWAFLAYSFF